MAGNGAVASNGTSQHQTLEDLTQTLSKFGLNEKISQFPNAYPTLNPVDIYRAHITDLLAPITGADPKVIYQAIQWTQTLDKGDVVLPVPALRLKGRKPDEVAKEIVEKVSIEAGRPIISAQHLPESVACMVRHNTDMALVSKKIVSRITSRPKTHHCRNIRSILLQTRTPRQPRHSHHSLHKPRLRLQPQLWPPRPLGPKKREEDDCRILVTEYRQTFPCGPSAKYNHWRVSGESVRKGGMGCD